MARAIGYRRKSRQLVEGGSTITMDKTESTNTIDIKLNTQAIKELFKL